MLSLSGHVGTKAAALVDGQLGAEEEERAWSHVLGCPGCRRLVEREGWVKQRLGALGTPEDAGAGPSSALLGSLYAVDAWAQVDALEQQGRRRRTTAVVVGGGAVAASVMGLIAFTGTPAGGGEVPFGPAPASIRGGTTATSVDDPVPPRPTARPGSTPSTGPDGPVAWRHRAR